MKGGIKLKHYIKYMKGNWKYAILAPILIMIDSLGMVVQPYFLQKIIDIGIANNDQPYIIKTGIIMIGCALVSLVGGFLAMYFSSKAAYSLKLLLKYLYPLWEITLKSSITMVESYR